MACVAVICLAAPTLTSGRLTQLAVSFQAQDNEMMQRRVGENSFGCGQSPPNAKSGSRELNIRPSMEARRRRLGLSALQVHPLFPV